MAVTWEVTIFISPPRRKIINGSSSFLGQPYMYKNNAREDAKKWVTVFCIYRRFQLVSHQLFVSS